MAVVKDLLSLCELTESDCEREVEEEDLAGLSLTLGQTWRALPSRLGVPSSDRVFQTEQEEKRAFLSQWKEVKGCEATYKALISALLEIHCREEAEGVCRVLTAPGPQAMGKYVMNYANDPVKQH